MLILNGTTIQNNWNITANGTSLTAVYACDTNAGTCEMVWAKCQGPFVRSNGSDQGYYVNALNLNGDARTDGGVICCVPVYYYQGNPGIANNTVTTASYNSEIPIYYAVSCTVQNVTGCYDVPATNCCQNPDGSWLFRTCTCFRNGSRLNFCLTDLWIPVPTYTLGRATAGENICFKERVVNECGCTVNCCWTPIVPYNPFICFAAGQIFTMIAPTTSINCLCCESDDDDYCYIECNVPEYISGTMISWMPEATIYNRYDNCTVTLCDQKICWKNLVDNKRYWMHFTPNKYCCWSSTVVWNNCAVYDYDDGEICGCRIAENYYNASNPYMGLPGDNPNLPADTRINCILNNLLFHNNYLYCGVISCDLEFTTHPHWCCGSNGPTVFSIGLVAGGCGFKLCAHGNNNTVHNYHQLTIGCCGNTTLPLEQIP